VAGRSYNLDLFRKECRIIIQLVITNTHIIGLLKLYMTNLEYFSGYDHKGSNLA
jgi:hypothetical protein